MPRLFKEDICVNIKRDQYFKYSVFSSVHQIPFESNVCVSLEFFSKTFFVIELDTVKKIGTREVPNSNSSSHISLCSIAITLNLCGDLNNILYRDTK